MSASTPDRLASLRRLAGRLLLVGGAAVAALLLAPAAAQALETRADAARADTGDIDAVAARLVEANDAEDAQSPADAPSDPVRSVVDATGEAGVGGTADETGSGAHDVAGDVDDDASDLDGDAGGAAEEPAGDGGGDTAGDPRGDTAGDPEGGAADGDTAGDPEGGAADGDPDGDAVGGAAGGADGDLTDTVGEATDLVGATDPAVTELLDEAPAEVADDTTLDVLTPVDAGPPTLPEPRLGDANAPSGSLIGDGVSAASGGPLFSLVLDPAANAPTIRAPNAFAHSPSAGPDTTGRGAEPLAPPAPPSGAALPPAASALGATSPTVPSNLATLPWVATALLLAGILWLRLVDEWRPADPTIAFAERPG